MVIQVMCPLQPLKRIKMFYIKRNTEEFGPYNAKQVQSAYISGSILKRDLIRHDNTSKYISIAEFLEMNNIHIQQKEEHIGEVFFNLLKLQSIILDPFKYLSSSIKENTIVYVLLAIVLIPILALSFAGIPFISYSIYGFYFASIWALILYKIIATKQTELQITLLIVPLTIIATIVVFTIYPMTSAWEIRLSFINSDKLLIKFIGMLFGVAIVEELLKQIVVYFVIFRSKKVLIPRTAIFYGMIAGLSFGIYEGVDYQMTLNKTLDINHNYYYNIIRLTSLPFFHAIWAGLGAYFASLSFINLRYKYSFRIVGVLIPAFLHALYNTFGLNILGILTIVFSSILLTVYLTKSDLVSKQINNL